MKLTMLHEEHKWTDEERAYAFCENEMWSGWPCETEGCPHCGGPGAPLAPDAKARGAYFPGTTKKRSNIGRKKRNAAKRHGLDRP